jgi:DNA polymerase V
MNSDQATFPLSKLENSATRALLASELLKPVYEPNKLFIPLVQATVSAGFPSPADDYVEGQLDLNEYFINHPSATFFVRVTGESMVGAGILPGDILIVDRSLEPRSGNIVIAVVEGELTVKRFFKTDSFIELRAENPNFKSIKINPVTDSDANLEALVWGVVSGVTRKV